MSADCLDCRLANLLNSIAMRTLIALFLMAVISLQAAAVAMGSYCQHEQDSVAQHLGHHDHQHKQTHPGGNAGTDLDCSLCLVGVVYGFPSELTLVSLTLPLADPVSVIAGQALAPPLGRPERPNWVSAV